MTAGTIPRSWRAPTRRAGLLGTAMIAGAVLSACSSLDPTSVLGEDDGARVPERVSEDSREGGSRESFPSLFDLDEDPMQRASRREEREETKKTLTADRDNARYADEALRADGVGARDSAEDAARQRTQEARAQESRARETAADAEERARQAEDATTAAARDAAREAASNAEDDARNAAREAQDSGPSVPPAPSETAQAEQAAAEQAAEAEAAKARADVAEAAAKAEAESERTAQRTADRAADVAAATPPPAPEETAEATQQSQTSPERASQAATQTAARQPANGAARAESGARGPSTVSIDTSQIPQIQPSRGGEPIRVPGEARRNGGVSGANGDQRAQRTSLRNPPASANDLRPGTPAPSAPGQRIAVIYFGHAGAGLNGQDRDVLRKVARIHAQRGGAVHIVGHASQRTATMDMVAHRMANLDISMKRAENVADTLVRFGVPREAIQVEARAARAPQYHEFMPTGEAGNRRAEIYLGRRG